jgi:hypothetical protein
MKVITMTHFCRPQYSRQVIDRLKNCVGIEEYLILPSIDLGSVEVAEMIGKIDFAECRPVVNDPPLGCNLNTQQAIRRGFEISDFVIHVEDDILLAPDALRMFERGEAFRHDKSVFTITGYNRDPIEIGQFHHLDKRPWFSCWGWATWRDRWDEIDRRLRADKVTWDVITEKEARNGRYEIFPKLSRVQNIGAENGVNVPSPEWHAVNHRTKHWAGDQRWSDMARQQAGTWAKF